MTARAKVEVSAHDSAPDDIVEVINPTGSGAFVLVCEHASNHVPAEFEDLGLRAEVLRSHVAWDLGAMAVARAMSVLLDCPLVAARVSRLVYDCNRHPGEPSAIPEQSEAHVIPGNVGLSEARRAARAARFFAPFHQTLSACIERRIEAGDAPAVVTVHSFTPVFHGVRRELDLGVLHDEDARMADAVLEVIGNENGLTARRNAPYGPRDGVTYTLAEHAVKRGLLNVMLEIRNDLIAAAPAQRAMAERLARTVTQACAVLKTLAAAPRAR